MSGAAIAMMLLAMLVIWGGLIAAIINLNRGGSAGEVTQDAGKHRDL
ncbi:methionine/alanine import family NSS transporter small subunit [Nocardioides sambongensis]|nr:methionine/alanine import family NSS transporter small subunit [Nocardioides sambongensis]